MANRRCRRCGPIVWPTGIFPPVRHVLFALRKVTAILRGHVPLFAADLAVVTMQVRIEHPQARFGETACIGTRGERFAVRSARRPVQAAADAGAAARCSSTGTDFDVGVLHTSPTLSSGTSGFVSG
jgi:hypothetical protein